MINFFTRDLIEFLSIAGFLIYNHFTRTNVQYNFNVQETTNVTSGLIRINQISRREIMIHGRTLTNTNFNFTVSLIEVSYRFNLSVMVSAKIIFYCLLLLVGSVGARREN